MLTLILIFLLGLTVDEGSGLDPHGGRVTAAACGDEGNGLDPHGKPCATKALGDEGTGIDPWGRR